MPFFSSPLGEQNFDTSEGFYLLDHSEAQSLRQVYEMTDSLCYLAPCTPSLCPENFPVPTKVKNTCFSIFPFFPILEIFLLCFLSSAKGVYETFFNFSFYYDV